jgi:hypothetical protein
MKRWRQNILVLTRSIGGHKPASLTAVLLARDLMNQNIVQSQFSAS